MGVRRCVYICKLLSSIPRIKLQNASICGSAEAEELVFPQGVRVKCDGMAVEAWLPLLDTCCQRAVHASIIHALLESSQWSEKEPTTAKAELGSRQTASSLRTSWVLHIPAQTATSASAICWTRAVEEGFNCLAERKRDGLSAVFETQVSF